MILSREKILGAVGKREVRHVPVPEIEEGGEVIVQSMTGAERDRFESGLVIEGKNGKQKADLKNVRARLVAATVVDEKGRKLFTPQDVEELGKISAAALDRIFEAARELSGMSQKVVEELAENLDQTQSEDATSD